MYDMTHSHVWAWLIHMCGRMTHSFVLWRIHTCDMTHPLVWHDSCIYVTWLRFRSGVLRRREQGVTRRIHICGMTHSYVTCCIHMHIHTHTHKHSHTHTHTHICVIWLVHLRETPPSYVTQISERYESRTIWKHQLFEDMRHDPFQDPISHNLFQNTTLREIPHADRTQSFLE